MSRDVDEEKLLSGVWPEWKIAGFIGSGSYGSVYKAVREEFSIKTYSAIKIISIPQDNSEIKELRTEGYDDEAIKKYYCKLTSQLVNEMECLISLKSATNIVKINDFKVVDKEDIGCTIYLRMELLIPFSEYILDKKLSQGEIIKLGIDICKALEHCNEQNIVHRDIKPDNILVSEHGEFKLGDFGIAKRLDNETSTMSHRGMSGYIAPEVFEGKKYNARADIYSLGIVLYKLLNNNRLPFVRQGYDEYVLSLDANRRRLKGEKFPVPVKSGKELSAVIIRACEYDPDKRFQNATEFREALENLVDTREFIPISIIEDVGENDKTLVANQMMFESEKSDNRKKLIIIGVILLIVLFTGGVAFAMSTDKIFIDSEKNKGTLNSNMSETVVTMQENSEDFITDTTDEVTGASEVDLTDEVTSEPEMDSTNEADGESNVDATDETTAESEIDSTDEVTSEPDSENTDELNTDEPETELEDVTDVVTEPDSELSTDELITEETVTEETTTEHSQDFYIVPDGCTYYDASSGEVYSSGSAIGITADVRDELRTNNYVYRYENIATLYDEDYLLPTYGGSYYTWSVYVKDKTKTEYEDIYDTIAGKDVRNMNKTFKECTNLKISPKIPNTVTEMTATFYKCESLEIPPQLPAYVESLNYTFSYCTSLKKIPEIPGSVTILQSTFISCNSLKTVSDIADNITDMSDAFSNCLSLEYVEGLPVLVTNLTNTFYNCINLKKAPEIPEGVRCLSTTFYGCTSIKEPPKIPNGVENMDATFLGCINMKNAPVIPDSVTNMEATFWECTSITKAPVIPAGVKNMRYTFMNCHSLTGEVIVNANPEIYDECFFGTYDIILKGSSNMLKELYATK